MRARHRLGKLLLRHDVRYDGASDTWTARHRDWLGRVELADRGAQVTLPDYLGAIDALVVRRDSFEATIAELVPGSPWAPTVARLRCLRGIDTLSAVGLCAEIGDFDRFERPGQLASYLGVVPSEDAPATAAASARSPKPGHGTPAGCSSKPPGTTAEPRPSAAHSPPATPARTPPSSPSPGKPNNACTTPGGASTTNAASAPPSSPSPSPANSPASAGRSPQRLTPTPPPRRSRRRRQRPTRESTRDHPPSTPPQPRSISRQRTLTTKPGPAATRIRA